jgi:hypothetical protein
MVPDLRAPESKRLKGLGEAWDNVAPNRMFVTESDNTLPKVLRSSRPHHHRTITRLHAARISRGEGNDPIKRGVVGYRANVCRNRGVPDFGGEIAQPVRFAGSDWHRRILCDETMDALQSFVLALRGYASNVGILDCYFSAAADSVGSIPRERLQARPMRQVRKQD